VDITDARQVAQGGQADLGLDAAPGKGTRYPFPEYIQVLGANELEGHGLRHTK
jgi:hypothetical protein